MRRASEELYGVADRERWIEQHFRQTRHTRYLHTVSDYRVVLPGEWL
ncbi:hypothetical protein GXW82_40510 [Streptacidiphilus sp. 4-A2]|nr:hypothetical protein [Streptacidiphilus sp. 4-A2]